MEDQHSEIASNMLAINTKCTSIVKKALQLAKSGNLSEAASHLEFLKDGGVQIVAMIENIITKQNAVEKCLIEEGETLQRQIGEMASKENKLKADQTSYQHELRNKSDQLDSAKDNLSTANSDLTKSSHEVDRVKERNKSRIITTSIIGGVAALVTGPIGAIVATGVIGQTLVDAERSRNRAEANVERRRSDVQRAESRISELRSMISSVRQDLRTCEDTISALNRKRNACHDKLSKTREKIVFLKQAVEFWSLLQNQSEENVDRTDLLIRILEKCEEKPKAVFSSSSQLLAEKFIDAWEEMMKKSGIGCSEFMLQ